MTTTVTIRAFRLLLCIGFLFTCGWTSGLLAQDATHCLGLTTRQSQPYLLNNCDFKVESFWCYPDQNHAYPCRTGGMGGGSWTLAAGAAYPLEDLEKGGRVLYLGCKSPAMPADIKYTGYGLTGRCK